MSKLLVQCLCLNETCRSIITRYYQIMSTLCMLKLGFSGYDVKPLFCAFYCEYRLQNPLFLWGKNFGGTRLLCEKNEPTLDRSGGGGGVHGKVCWLIAYISSCNVNNPYLMA